MSLWSTMVVNINLTARRRLAARGLTDEMTG
jgi:hypothetical protein